MSTPANGNATAHPTNTNANTISDLDRCCRVDSGCGVSCVRRRTASNASSIPRSIKTTADTNNEMLILFVPVDIAAINMATETNATTNTCLHGSGGLAGGTSLICGASYGLSLIACALAESAPDRSLDMMQSTAHTPGSLLRLQTQAISSAVRFAE